MILVLLYTFSVKASPYSELRLAYFYLTPFPRVEPF